MADLATEKDSAWKSAWVALPIGAALVLAVVAVVRHARETQLKPRPDKIYLYEEDRKYRAVDPALIKYREAGRLETAFRQPRGIALDGAGRLLIAGDKAIRRFSADGKPQAEWPLSGEPRSLAVAEDGRIYVAFMTQVEVLSADGKPQAKWTALPKPAYFTSIAVSAEDVWVADSGNRLVWRHDHDGHKKGDLGRQNDATGYPGLVIPSPHLDVAVSADGTIWVTNPGKHRLECYDRSELLLRNWGRPAAEIDGFCGCCNPTDFALLPDRRFVTSEKGLARVKVYGAEGKFECVVAAPEVFAEDVVGLDLAADAQGRIYVLDPSAKAVRIFARKD
jgi:hypothetical protein